MRKAMMLGVMLAVCVSATVDVSASGINIYTDTTEWENALGGQFLTEDFSDHELNTGISFVSTESGHINPAMGYYQDVLTSESHNEPMTTWSFAPEITAYGGNWTLGGPGGSGNSLLVYIDDWPAYVGYIPNSYGGDFWGFTSDTPFTSVKLIGAGGTHQQNYRLDDMVYSRVDPFPAPGDANGDGCVDDLDLTTLAVHWQQATDLWEHGNFNSDGVVNDLDLTALAVNWQQGCGGGGSFADAWSAAQANVPEPATLSLLAIGGLAVLRRRRK